MELSHDSDLIAVIKMLNTFGRHSGVVCAYTELFGLRPLKSKTKKWRILLEDMKRLFESESFSYKKRIYKISQAGIVEALNIVIRKYFEDHLENHNYLKKVMIGIAEDQSRNTSRDAEKELRKKEKRLQAGNRHIDQEEQAMLPSMKTMPASRLTEEQIAENKRRLKEMSEKIG